MKKLTIIFLLFFGLSALYCIDRWQVVHWNEEQKIELETALERYRSRLQNTLDSRFMAIKSLASLIIIHPDTSPDEFSRFADFILKLNPPIRAIQFADSDTKVIYVYPPKDNEITIKKPMILLADPKRSSYVKKAIREKKSTVQGPFNLRQGGTGVVVRFPVFDNDRFLGLAIGVYDLPVLINEALLGLECKDIAFHLKDSTDNPFWSNVKVPATKDSITRAINLAGLNWKISAVRLKKSGPPVITRTLILFFGGCFLLSVLLYLQIIWKQEKTLKVQVEKRTQDLSASNKNLLTEVLERKQVENELKSSEEKFYKAFQNAPILMTISAIEDGRCLDVNDAFTRVTGYSREDVIGLTSIELGFITPEERSRIVQALDKDDRINDLELEATRADGSKMHCLYSGEIVNISGKKRLLSLAMDITDRKAMEQKIQHTQKMETIGSLASGIAHDFNNILFPIVGLSDIMIEDLSEDSVEYQNLKQISIAGKRGTDLVKQILAFSRQSDENFLPVQFQKILKEVIKLSRSTIPKDITIHTEIEKNCGFIYGNPTQLHQIAMNLITNAYHAVKRVHGAITVKLSQTELKDESFQIQSPDPGQYVVLSVSDTGDGIEPTILNKIFEPYFTTREQGKGTGLGLSVTQGIVKEYGGHISVESIVGEGTSFTVYLPAMETIEENSEDKIDSIIPTGNETVLLVDDERPIVNMLKTMLERLGYTVSPWTDSLGALKAFEDSPDDFDLVLSDLSMPNMTGDQLAREILSVRSDIPIIICTGFSETIHRESILQSGAKGLIYKPVIKSEMAKLIRSVLDDTIRGEHIQK